MSAKLNYLNVGCGKKFHPDWENVDMVAYSRHVRAHNILKGFPYPSNQFEVVYHSQVLEHIPKEKALFFIKECYRVLKPGGILRVVCPNLEGIVNEYQKFLQQNLTNPTPESEASYDWIMLELYDQTVRNKTGGEMATYLQADSFANEAYLAGRVGKMGRQLRHQVKPSAWQRYRNTLKEAGPINFLKLYSGFFVQKLLNALLGGRFRAGNFRFSGEIHYWMYDRFSLGRLLRNAGFKDPVVKDPYSSDVPDWGVYELDVTEGIPYDPSSLFMEARK